MRHVALCACNFLVLLAIGFVIVQGDLYVHGNSVATMVDRWHWSEFFGSNFGFTLLYMRHPWAWFLTLFTLSVVLTAWLAFFHDRHKP